MSSTARKILSVIMILAITFSLPVYSMASLQPIVSNDETIVDFYVLEQIDELYNIRGKLAIDFEKNKEKIADIDQQILSLGAVEVSNEYVANKAANATIMNVNENSVLPTVTVPSSSNIQWTSTRTYMTHQGLSLEVQILTAAPSASDSPLINGQAEIKKTKAGSMNAAATKILSVTATSIIGLIPVVGSVCSGITSIADIIEAGGEAVTQTTTVSDAEATYLTTYTANQKLIYIKLRNESDNEQIICYAGNKIYYSTGISMRCDRRLSDGTIYAYSKSYDIPENPAIPNDDCSIYSQYYNSPLGFSCLNYYNSINGNATNVWNYVTSFTESFLSGSRSINVQFVMP